MRNLPPGEHSVGNAQMTAMTDREGTFTHTWKVEEEYYKSGEVPGDATFFFRLPFNLTIPEGTEHQIYRTFDDAEPLWVAVAVHKIRIPLADATFSPYLSGLAVVLGDKSSANEEDGSSGQTWVSARTSAYIFNDEDAHVAKLANGLTTLAFERCLRAVNKLIAADTLRTGNIWAHTITKEALDHTITYVLDHPDDQSLEIRQSLKLHNRPYNPLPVSTDPNLVQQIQETLIMQLSSESQTTPHPFIVARELGMSGMAAVHSGNPHQPVLLLQASIERHLRGLLRMLLIDQGLPDVSVKRVADESLFTTVLRTSLPKILGGDWSSETSPVTKYKRDLYAVRNNLIHGGRMPNWQQLNPAILAHRSLIDFLEGRVLRSWRKSPRTLLSVSDPAAGGSLKLPKGAKDIMDRLKLERIAYWLADDVANRNHDN